MSLFGVSTTAPFGSQCQLARRAKPALTWGQELVAPLCAIQIGWVGDEMSPEHCEGAIIHKNTAGES